MLKWFPMFEILCWRSSISMQKFLEGFEVWIIRFFRPGACLQGIGRENQAHIVYGNKVTACNQGHTSTKPPFFPLHDQSVQESSNGVKELPCSLICSALKVFTILACKHRQLCTTLLLLPKLILREKRFRNKKNEKIGKICGFTLKTLHEQHKSVLRSTS